MNRNVPWLLFGFSIAEAGLVVVDTVAPMDCDCQESPRMAAVPLTVPDPEERSLICVPKSVTLPASAASSSSGLSSIGTDGLRVSDSALASVLRRSWTPPEGSVDGRS